MRPKVACKTQVLTRCLNLTGGDYAEYADDVQKLIEEGSRRTEENAPRSPELKDARKKLFRLFHMAFRQHANMKATPPERAACEACGIELPSEALLAFEKKHGTPEYLKDAKDPLLADMELRPHVRPSSSVRDPTLVM